MKTQELVDYRSPGYACKAVKIGAGVEVAESYRFAQKHGLVSVGGDFSTVGIVGGWNQGGGGHGPGVSKFGLGADQASESELVTGTGENLITNQQTNQDLYWALSGGGGGTYGIVSSMTIKVYPDLTSSAATLNFAFEGANGDAFWDAVETWQRSLPTITNNGCFAIWTISTRGFQFVPANCSGLSRREAEKMFKSTSDNLHQNGDVIQFAEPTMNPLFTLQLANDGV
jgi:FAD/FMN-containing dehydrogenase